MERMEMSEISRRTNGVITMLQLDLNHRKQRGESYVDQQKQLIEEITEMSKSFSSRTDDYFYLNFMRALRILIENFDGKYKALSQASFVSELTRDYMVSFSKELLEMERSLTLEHFHISSLPPTLTTEEKDELIGKVRPGIGNNLSAYFDIQQGGHRSNISASDCLRNIFIFQMIECYIIEHIPTVDKQRLPLSSIGVPA